jgi:hypothetical protein
MLYALNVAPHDVSLHEKAISLRIDAYDYRAIFLFSVCITYAIFGSPTPDIFGLVEAFLGVF